MTIVPSPSAGTCYFFSGSHYRTFDGSIVSFNRPGCRHTLVSEPLTDSLRVGTQAREVKTNSILLASKNYVWGWWKSSIKNTIIKIA